ncbi:hypothetical protein OGATHE_003224 [Ogataea polymorpha]|uniref:Uncharacterized protein n=1 Tax=Ogataea polymorpha TaxID=460523 RepID=A0A9P8T786_9ASCO|nr:hypothetical protein OGATHE_003224 [Ogataea polymorpha]
MRASPHKEHLASIATGLSVSYLNILRFRLFTDNGGEDGADCACAAFQSSVEALNGSMTTFDSNRLLMNHFFWKNLIDGDRSRQSDNNSEFTLEGGVCNDSWCSRSAMRRLRFLSSLLSNSIVVSRSLSVSTSFSFLSLKSFATIFASFTFSLAWSNSVALRSSIS